MLRETLAMEELLWNSCGWMARRFPKNLRNKKVEKPPQLMALLQALVFLKQAANQPEIGFGMALAGQPARSQSRQQSEQAGTAGFGMRLGGGRRGHHSHPRPSTAAYTRAVFYGLPGYALCPKLFKRPPQFPLISPQWVG